MAVSSITGKKKATTVAKNTGNSSGSQVSSIGTQSRVLRNAPTSTSKSGGMTVSSNKNNTQRNTSRVSSIGSSSNSKKATGQLGGSKAMSFADRIAANNGIAPQETPELPGIEPIPTDNTETLDLAKTYMGGDAEGISSPEDSSWAGVDRKTGMTQTEKLAADAEAAQQAQFDLEDAQQTQTYADQGQFIEDNAKQKKYQEDQEALRVEGQDIQNQSADIQADQQITETQTQLHNLKQNIGFLGQMGQPGVAQAALDAVDRQLVQAQQIFKDTLKLNSNRKAISSINTQQMSMQFAKQMQDLQDDLDNNVSKVIQDAFNKVIMADGDGKLDSMEELNDFRREILASVDTSIEGITQGNVIARQRALDAALSTLENTKAAMEYDDKRAIDANTVNIEESAVKGFVVNSFGEPIVGTDGNTIPYKNYVVAPKIDEASGNLVEVTMGPDGNLVTTLTPVIDKPTFENTTIATFASLVASGKLGYGDVPAAVQSNPMFLEALNNAPVEGDQGDDLARKKAFSDLYQTNPDLANTLYPDLAYDQSESNPEDVSFKGKDISNTILSGNVDALSQAMEYGVEYDCGTRSECGERYNDAVGGKNNTWVGNSYQDKLQYAVSMEEGAKGDGVVFDVNGNPNSVNGHIGVLASGLYTNAEGVEGYDVISANAYDTNKLTKDFVPKSLIDSSGGGFIPTTAMEEQQQQESNQKEGPIGALGVPIAFERGVKAMVPATLMNSQVELAQLDDTIKAMHKAGMNNSEAALVYMGFDVQEENKDLALQLIDVARGLPEGLAKSYAKNLSDMLNAGNVNGAVRLAETTAYSQAEDTEGDNFISDANTKTVVGRAQELEDILTELSNSGENPIGRFDGTLQKWLKKFKGKDAEEIANRATKLIMEMQVDTIGTQTTKAESNILKPIIPDLSDKTVNFNMKLTRLKEEPLRELNNMRTQYGLPELTSEQLLDNSLRTDLYRGGSGLEQADAEDAQPPTQSSYNPVYQQYSGR